MCFVSAGKKNENPDYSKIIDTEIKGKRVGEN